MRANVDKRSRRDHIRRSGIWNRNDYIVPLQTGCCWGIGEYLNVDSTIIRLLWAILVFWGGIGILAYLVAAVIIPGQPDYR